MYREYESEQMDEDPSATHAIEDEKMKTSIVQKREDKAETKRMAKEKKTKPAKPAKRVKPSR